MNTAFSALCGAINFMPPWIMLGVFGAIVLLIVVFIAFKGVKRGVKFIILGLILMVGAYLVYLCVQIALWDLNEIIAFAIAWLPTILFVLIVMTATFVNAKRGLRKSLILAIHACCAGAVAVAFFFIMVGVKEVDAGVLNFLNWLMGGDGALQRALGVPESCATLKEVIAEYIPILVGTESDLGLLLKDNAAYIYTLVDMTFRIIMAVLSTLVYFSFVFILYLVYHLCYSQRKYKKNRIAEFQNGKTDKNYRKHHIGGGAVGFVRGVAVGLLSLSFIGSAFFVVAGGKGEGKLKDYDFGDENANYFYELYRSIDGYGSQGIFKILNAMTDASDTPFYLFAADLIFSGELNDEELGVTENIKFREEFAALTGFARDTLDLMMKYGSDELNAIVGGEVSDGAFDTVVEVMTRTGFKEEFNELIDAFDTQTYVINLGMSLVNSIVRNVDEISFTAGAIGEGERELIKLIFKKGFLTENIPDEREIIAQTGKVEAEGEDIRPYLTVKHILNKNDVKVVLNLVLSILANDETGDTLTLAQRVVPEIGKLSILSTERKSELNPVLGRMYCLFENLYLTDEGEDGVTYAEIRSEDIDWIKEMNTLLAVSVDAITLYDNVFAEGGEALDTVKRLFDENSANFTENMRIYDELCDFLTESDVLGRALSTSFIYNTLYDALKGLAEGVYIPRDLSFVNTTDNHGNVVYGEIYQLFKGVKLLCTGENKDALDKILELGDQSDIHEMLNMFADIVKSSDESGNTVSDYLVNSKILRGVISIELINAANAGSTFYVPKAALEKVEGEYVNLILKNELSQLMESMDRLVEFVKPFEGDSNEWANEGVVDGFINDETFYSLVEGNRIFEGTVAQILRAKLGGVLTVPADIMGEKAENIDGWITVDGQRGELLNLIDSLRIANFNVSDILSSSSGDEFDQASVIQKITEMTEEDLEVFFASRSLHYTVSNYLIGGKAFDSDGLILVIPNEAREVLFNDNIDYIVKKDELIFALKEISQLGVSDLDFTDGSAISQILVKVAKNKDTLNNSKIIAASIIATMVKNTDIADNLLSIPADLKRQGDPEILKYFDSTNAWTEELPALITALDEILGLRDKDENYEFGEDDINAAVSELLTTLNDAADTNGDETKLGVLYDSIVVRNKITCEIDEALINGDVVDGFVINYVKIDGYYTFEELQALSNAVNALGITSLDEISDFDFKNSVNKETLGDVYKSVIAEGIITKTVKEVIASSEEVVDHPLAYRNELAVYKQSEIEAILELYGNLETGKVDTTAVGDYVYDEATGEPKSYILVASATRKLITCTGLIIPDVVYDDKNDIIAPIELWRLAKAFNAIKDDYAGLEDIDEWTEDTEIIIPDKSVRSVVFDSVIMRARITFQLVKLNGNNPDVLAVFEDNGSVVYDVREPQYFGGVYRPLINKAQLEYFADTLEIINENNQFTVPAFDDLTDVLGLIDSGNLELAFKSDIIRYRICELLHDKYHLTLREENAFRLGDRTVKPAYTASSEEIENMLSSFFNN